MHGFAAVVLDFDGLILDTESSALHVWSEVYREHGHELDLGLWQRGVGTHGGFDAWRHLEGLTGGALDRAALGPAIHERHLQMCKAQPLLPGVRRLLEDAAALGLRAAVASSSSRGWVEGWLGRHGIRSLLASVCGRDDVVSVKPAPDLYLKAAERLGVVPAVCVAFEDSPNGVRAARAAGMACVAVPNGVTRGFTFPETDLTVESLAELRLPELLEILGRPAQRGVTSSRRAVRPEANPDLEGAAPGGPSASGGGADGVAPAGPSAPVEGRP